MPHRSDPVESRRDRKLFFDLPWDLYRGRSQLDPPLRNRPEGVAQLQASSVLRRRSYPQFSGAQRRQAPWAASRPSIKPLPTIGGSEKRGLLRFLRIDRRRGRSPPVLVRRRPRLGLQSRASRPSAGPSIPSLNYEVGLLIEGFERSALVYDDLHNAYYAAARRSARLPARRQDMFAFWVTWDLEEVTSGSTRSATLCSSVSACGR